MFRVLLTACARAPLALALATSLSLGCGGGAGHATVSGVVSVNGEPIKSGRIVYRPLQRSAGNGGSAEIADGNYQLKDVPTGRSVFMFSGSALTGKTIPGQGGRPETERVNVIPRDVLRDGVEREIESDGPQDFSLEGPV